MLAIEILGFTTPDERPLFVAALLLHIAAGLTATVAGALAALSRKRRGRHPHAGTVFLAGASVVALTATVMAVMRWSHNWHLFLIATVTVSLAWFGWLARHREWHQWQTWHGSAMGMAYIGLLTGFYVDNGERLPVWDRLPPLSYWLIPAAVGVPLILAALARNQALPGRRRRRVATRP